VVGVGAYPKWSQSNLANNLFASACVSLRQIISFATFLCDQARGLRPPSAVTCPPQIRTTSAPFLEWYLREAGLGAIMLRIAVILVAILAFPITARTQDGLHPVPKTPS
jgi:hypothetical protein